MVKRFGGHPLSNAQPPDDSKRQHALAMAYIDQMPWADVVALEANLAVMGTGAALGRAMARAIEPFGFNLGPPRYAVVRVIFLSEDGRLSLSEIAKRVGVTTTNITNLIDGLERDGWVERQAHPSDRRVTYVRLTTDGLERCSRLIPARSILSPRQRTPTALPAEPRPFSKFAIPPIATHP